MTKEIKKLEDCPYCGGKAISVDGHSARCEKGETGYPMRCAGAMVRIPIDKWNTRPAKRDLSLDKLKVAIIIQQNLRRADILPKGSVDCISLKTAEWLAKKICQNFRPQAVKVPEKREICEDAWHDYGERGTKCSSCGERTNMKNQGAASYNAAIDEVININKTTTPLKIPSVEIIGKVLKDRVDHIWIEDGDEVNECRFKMTSFNSICEAIHSEIERLNQERT